STRAAHEGLSTSEQDIVSTLATHTPPPRRQGATSISILVTSSRATQEPPQTSEPLRLSTSSHLISSAAGQEIPPTSTLTSKPSTRAAHEGLSTSEQDIVSTLATHTPPPRRQ
ncbi:unnamed protein product, partial [Rotaria sp. Silwood1]